MHMLQHRYERDVTSYTNLSIYLPSGVSTEAGHIPRHILISRNLDIL